MKQGLVISLFVWLSLGEISKSIAQQDEHGHEDHDLEEVTVQATRTKRRIQDGALRVEVLAGEEIGEKLLMRPSNISMMLNETGGLRVQVTSPGLGSANVRVHGMRGRYTQLLADGLPLYGGQASSLGLLQIPPSDLGQVEIIKGAASALYGGQALGGVVNLVSKYPAARPSGEVVLNATTRGGQDISVYGEGQPFNPLRSSFLANFSRQSAQDLDGDSWVDMPRYDRIAVRPRFFLESNSGTRALITIGAMTEDRRGGTTGGGTVPDGNAFLQNQKTRRLDGGVKFSYSLDDLTTFDVRASSMRQSHDHLFGRRYEVDSHETQLLEFSVARNSSIATWVGGVAYQEDRYQSKSLPEFDYRFRVPALFGQFDLDISEDVSFAASARWDSHNVYGAQASPRVSLLYQPGNWTLRGSWGQGFYAPTPFIEETEAAGLFELTPLAGLDVEQADTASLDLGYSAGNLEAGITLFASDIDKAIAPKRIGDGEVIFVNLDELTKTRGAELLLRWRAKPFAVTANYLYLDATEQDAEAQLRRHVSLTPRHSAGLVAMWEEHDRGRVGIELYYTGEQRLSENPYRTRSKSYWHIGLLGEIKLGGFSLFLNLENILDVRQTRTDPLLRQTRTPLGAWTLDVWAPLEGFIANAGFRKEL